MMPTKKEAPDGAAVGSGVVSDAITISKAELVASVTEIVKTEVKAVRDEIANDRTPATKNAGGLSTASDAPVTSGQKHATEGTGLDFVRQLKAQGMVKIFGATDVDSVLKAWGYDYMIGMRKAAREELIRQKGMSASIFADGGAFVVPKFSSELIALLRNQTVVRKAGARSVPLEGTLQIPKATGAGQAFYRGEGAPATLSQQTVGGLNMTERFLVAATVATNQFIKLASVAAEQFILDDLRNVMSLREDLAFLFGDGASDTPRGIESLLASANKFDATAVAPKAPTLAEVRKEFAKIIGRLKKNNIPMTKPTWLMSPRTEEYISGLTDGNGNAVYESQLEKGMLRGFPVIVTNQIGEDKGNTAGTGSDWSRLMFIDVDHEIIGDGDSVSAEVNPGGTYEVAGVAKSGLMRGETVIMLTSSHDHLLRYDTCGVSCAVEWGAP